MRASRRGGRFLVAGMVTVGLLVMISPAWGNEGQHAAGQLRDFLYRCLDTGVTLGLLGYFLFGPLKRALVARRNRIAAELEEGRRAVAEMEARHAAGLRELAAAGSVVEELRSGIRRECEIQREQILASGRQAAAQLQAQVTAAAQREVSQARQVLQREAARQAVALAEQLVREAMTPEDHRRLLETALQQVAEES